MVFSASSFVDNANANADFSASWATEARRSNSRCVPTTTNTSLSITACHFYAAFRYLSDTLRQRHLASVGDRNHLAMDGVVHLDLGSVEKRRFKCHDESCHSLRRTRWRWRQEPCAMLVRGRAASRIGDSHGDSIVSGKRSLVTSIIRLDTKCTTVVLLAFEPPRDGNSEEPSMQVVRSSCRDRATFADGQQGENTICDTVWLGQQIVFLARKASCKLYFWHAKPPVALSPGFVLGLERLIMVARPNL
ncbi:hypothetical protein BN1723_001542, partial [Verticillium longisporum]